MSLGQRTVVVALGKKPSWMRLAGWSGVRLRDEMGLDGVISEL